MCSKCLPPAVHAHEISTVMPLVNHSVGNVLFRVKPSLHQAFLQVTYVTNVCFIHALLHNTPNFIIYRSIRLSYMIHLMQFCSVISHC